MNNNNKKYLLFIIPVVIAIADLVTKYFIAQDPRPFQQEVIGNFFRFTFVYNEGMIFGILNNANVNAIPFILSGLALVALSVIVYMFLKMDRFVKDGRPQIWAKVATMLVAGGALGNNLDRLFFFNDPSIPGHHAVVDFIDVGIGDTRWYHFNIADCGIVVGTIILAVMFLFFEKKVEKAKDAA